jgi:hypothetical protein
VSDFSEFYLNSKSSVARLECLEISHASFSQTYRLVRNAVHGVTVTHEDDNDYAYTYMPMRVELPNVADNLDHVLQVVLGDLGEIVPMELDRVKADDALKVNPVVVLRTYRSDDLSAPLDGPIVLEVRRFVMDRKGCAFEAKAPSLNVSRTGENYSIARFSMMSGMR